VTWLPFDLHPEYPPAGLPRAELIARYGGSMNERLRDRFAEEGLEYNPNPDVIPNSFDALRLTELARDLGRHEEIHDRFMDAYWRDAVDLGIEELTVYSFSTENWSRPTDEVAALMLEHIDA
jgi:predicted DsbA family dithiol-disulfide isomerase